MADTLDTKDINAGLEWMESCALFRLDPSVPSGSDGKEEAETSYTAELVSPCDPLVEDTFRAPLAGAIGEIVMSVRSDVLNIRLDLSPQGTTLGGSLYDSDKNDSSDKASIAAEPYGPSRSNTLDCDALEAELIGNAPSGHLGDLVDAMMQKLPERMPASTFSNIISAAPDVPASYLLSPETRQTKDEPPRLWRILLSPQVGQVGTADSP